MSKDAAIAWLQIWIPGFNATDPFWVRRIEGMVSLFNDRDAQARREGAEAERAACEGIAREVAAKRNRDSQWHLADVATRIADAIRARRLPTQETGGRR